MNDVQEVVRREAMRVVPGILAARLRNDATGAAVLMRDYQLYASSYGLSKAEAWMVLWTATMHWTLELACAMSEEKGVSPESYVQLIGMTAAAWEAEGAVHGE